MCKLPPAIFESRREFVQHPVTFQKKPAGCFSIVLLRYLTEKIKSSLTPSLFLLTYLRIAYYLVMVAFWTLTKPSLLESSITFSSYFYSKTIKLNLYYCSRRN